MLDGPAIDLYNRSGSKVLGGGWEVQAERRLQVFVSSTYTDLIPERQAAVEAILRAKHIPAGMELFASEDASQMEVIRRWIDDSDAFLLILGGRYGTMHKEEGKSYVELEWEYAGKAGKPRIALVVDQKHNLKKRNKTELQESNYQAQLASFRAHVCDNRLVSMWDSLNSIRYHVTVALMELRDRAELQGWVRAERIIDHAKIAEQLAELTRRNSELEKDNRELREAAAVSSRAVGDPGILQTEDILMLTPLSGAGLPEKLAAAFKEIGELIEYPNTAYSLLGAMFHFQYDLREKIPELPKAHFRALAFHRLVNFRDGEVGITSLGEKLYKAFLVRYLRAKKLKGKEESTGG